MNVAVMFPAGKILNRYYDIGYDDREKVYLYNNVGDLLVYDSTLKIINPDQLVGLTISKKDPSNIDWINENCDYAFLRGSNYFHSAMKWPDYTLSALKKIKVPIVPMGIGFQCAEKKMPNLSEETKEVLNILSHSCNEIGVRGSFSAECLSELGIKNVAIIGCPSMYRKMTPKIKVDSGRPVSKIAFTLRREVSRHYSEDISRYLSVQKALIEQSLDMYETTVVCQGEVEEKIIFYNRPELEGASTRIKNDFPMSESLFSQYKKKLKFFDEIPEYENFMISNDLTIGFRLHGNAMPLANGKNTVYITYDSRTREFVDTYKIPHYDIADPDFPTIKQIVENPFDFTDFEKNYEKMYSVFSEFLNCNGVDHRL